MIELNAGIETLILDEINGMVKTTAGWVDYTKTPIRSRAKNTGERYRVTSIIADHYAGKHQMTKVGVARRIHDLKTYAEKVLFPPYPLPEEPPKSKASITYIEDTLEWEVVGYWIGNGQWEAKRFKCLNNALAKLKDFAPLNSPVNRGFFTPEIWRLTMDYEYDYEAPVSANADSNYELNELDLSDYFAKLAEEGL